MRHGKNDELVNAIRVSRSREPRHGGSPVVANDVGPPLPWFSTYKRKAVELQQFDLLPRTQQHSL